MSDQIAPPNAVLIERTFSAPAEKLYRAWLEPDLILQWMAPGSFTIPRAEVDERVGGKYSIWHSQDGEPQGGFESEILELVPNERIVFAWGFVGPERSDGPVYDSKLTVTFNEDPKGDTKLTLLHEQLDSLRAAMPEGAEMVGPGWDMVLDKLERVA
jgi:uncharacterized protein YndB with AHSA1/START domain